MHTSARVWGSIFLWIYGWQAAVAVTATPVPLRIGLNFTASRFGIESDASPADANGSAGPQHFVEFINGRFSVYDKVTGTRVQTKTDIQFWNAAGVTFTSTVGTTDPRLIFDTYSQRWFASMVSFTINSPRQRSNRFLLAVSQTPDPTGKWLGFGIASDPNNLYFADFPTLGLDRDAVYMSGDMFDRNGNPIGPSLVAIPKSSLLADPASITGRTYLGQLTYGARGDVLQPAVTRGAADGPESLLAVSDLGLDFQPLSTLVLSQVRNGAETNGAGLLSPPVVLTVPPYSVPINPPQPDGTTSLDDGDARFASAVQRVGNILYATHAIQIDNRAAVRWYMLNATNNSVIQSGNIADPDLDLFYPSIAANESGVVVVGCNGSSETTFVSSYAAVGLVTNRTLSFGALTLLKSGQDSYQNTDSSGTGRWGDYSTTTVDPSDPNRFWTIQMIALSKSVWATQITELITGLSSPAPSLAVVRKDHTVILSWPAGTVGVQLQTSPRLAPASWTTVADTPDDMGSNLSISLPESGSAAFFRLAPAP